MQCPNCEREPMERVRWTTEGTSPVSIAFAHWCSFCGTFVGSSGTASVPAESNRNRGQDGPR